MIKVYTTIEGLSLNENVCLMKYTELPYYFVEWINKKTMDLLKNNTQAERDFSELLKQQSYSFVQQAFFRINNKNYFLDFFFPELNIAIELNGAIHKDKVCYDFDRDFSFQKIGIKTIRITNDFIYRNDIKDKLNEYFKKAIGGKFDSSNYYDKNNVNRFENKYSTNQKFLLSAIDSISHVVPKTKVLIKTTSTYLLSVLNHLDMEYLEKYENQNLIKKFYDIVYEKEIAYDVIFSGNRQNVKGKLAKYINNLDNTYMKKEKDVTILLDSESINKYDNWDFED